MAWPCVVPGARVAVPLGLSVIIPTGVKFHETEWYAFWVKGIVSAILKASHTLQPTSALIVTSTYCNKPAEFVFPNECPGLCRHRPGQSLGKNESCLKWRTKKTTWVFLCIKYSKFWSVSLEHFVERKPLIYEEWHIVSKFISCEENSNSSCWLSYTEKYYESSIAIEIDSLIR